MTANGFHTSDAEIEPVKKGKVRKRTKFEFLWTRTHTGAADCLQQPRWSQKHIKAECCDF